MVSNIFYLHPYLGKWSNLTNIFQRGWNHQLAVGLAPAHWHFFLTEHWSKQLLLSFLQYPNLRIPGQQKQNTIPVCWCVNMYSMYIYIFAYIFKDDRPRFQDSCIHQDDIKRNHVTLAPPPKKRSSYLPIYFKGNMTLLGGSSQSQDS